MRRITVIISVLMLVFGLTQCKKNLDIITPVEGIRITLDVDGGSKADVTPPSVAFANGDVIYVGSNGKYVGTLTHNGSKFSGSISEATEGQRLYFYFLGNKAPSDIMNSGVSGVLTAGSTTSLSVNISDQSNVTLYGSAYKNLPVISMGESTENYSTSVTEYSSKLYNKCSLMKFNVTTPSAAAVFITGMNNKVTLDFSKPTDTGDGLTSGTNNGFSYSADDNKLIKLFGGSGEAVEKWAIVLPQNALAEGATGTVYTADGLYEGSRPAIATISSNQFLNSGLDMTVNTSLNMNNTPVTFVAKTAGATIEFVKVGSPADVSIQYSIDGGSNWSTYEAGTTGAITLSKVGDRVMFRASDNNTTFAKYEDNKYHYHRFHVTNDGDFYAYGNVMSLLYTDFSTKTSFPAGSTYTFYKLFNVNREQETCHIYNHPVNEFILPATTMTDYCYYGMFFDCTKMTKAPALPAKNLAVGCYNSMFCYCESLTTAPTLPATVLANACYKGMFYYCTGLETAPELSVTTLVSNCYEQMFEGCSNLSSITCLATNISATDCTANWLKGVAVSGTFTKATAEMSWPEGASGIPSGWTVQNAAK